MSRQPRFVLPSEPQHVIQRGNNRDVIFVADEDYHFYLEKLEAAWNEKGSSIILTVICHLYMIFPCPDLLLEKGSQLSGKVENLRRGYDT